MADLTGKVLKQRYRIVRKIGEGAMSEVYLAHDAQHPQIRFALKVLKDELVHQVNLGQRFRAEGKVLARLSHPGIVRVHEVFEETGSICMVLDFIEGRSLGDALHAEGAIEAAAAARLFDVILAALDYAHQSGVIHRDVKPSNILIDRASGLPQLCDFGIARQIGQRGLTGAGMTLGTPQYMSPEQIQAPQSIDHRSDLYSAGVMLYETLTGHLPFGDAPTDSDFAILKQQVEMEPPDPKSVKPDLDDALCRVLRKALQKDPGRRYQGGSEFRAAIAGAIAGAMGGRGLDGEIDAADRADPPEPAEARPERIERPREGTAAGQRYAVYRHPSRGNEAVKLGFSWPALLLGEFWMVAKGLVAHALLWLACSVGVLAMLLYVIRQHRETVTDGLALLLLLVLLMTRVLPALRGNGWREERLVRQGYVFVGEVQARSAGAAVPAAVSAGR